MKKIIVIVLFMYTTRSMAQNLYWSEEYTVADISYGYYWPRLVLAKGNQPVVVWGNNSDKAFYSARWNGNGFHEPVRVTPDGIEGYVSKWTGAEIAASGDTVFIVYNTQPFDAGHCYLQRSVDGGLSFADTVRMDYLVDSYARFPAVTIQPGGDPLAIFMKIAPNDVDPQYVVLNSTDGGQSFEPYVEAGLLVNGEACDCCPGFVLSDAGKNLFMFRNNEQDIRDIHVVMSPDGSDNFTMAAQIDHTNWNTNYCPATGPDGLIIGDSIYSAWKSSADGKNRVYIGSVSIDSLTPGYNRKILADVPANANQNYPRMAGSNDTLGIVWQESHSGTSNVLFAYTSNGIENLSTVPDTISFSAAGIQKNPDIDFFNGIFYMAWQDDNAHIVKFRMASFNGLSGRSEMDIRNDYINLYPNPVTDKLLLSCPYTNDVIQVRIRDVHGNMLEKKVMFNGKLEFSFKKYASGLYIIDLYGNNQFLGTKKIFKL